MPNAISTVLNSIDTKQFAYPDYRELLVDGESNVDADGFSINYKWHTFKEMVLTERGYDNWMWPMTALYVLQQAELLHHSASRLIFNIIGACEGRLKNSSREQLGSASDYIYQLQCGKGKAQMYVQDNALWRTDYMHKVYEWYAKTGGWRA